MIEALLLSVDEPQLGKCLELMNSQTIPFSNIVHINNVVPQSEAYNRGISLLKDDWFMLTAGDVYLTLDAVERNAIEIKGNNDSKVVGHLFDLWDGFLKMQWGGIGTFRTDVLKSTPIMDRLCNDGNLGKELDGKGWTMKRHPINIGTHFEDVDEFQVFRRFYVMGLKYNGTKVARIGKQVARLFRDTGNPLYLMAEEAMHFAGDKKGLYPGSHNIDFEKKIYEEFNALQTS